MKKEKIERILFATDYLESSRLALDYAVALAHHFKATLVMLHWWSYLGPLTRQNSLRIGQVYREKRLKELLDAFAAGARRASMNV